MPQLTSTFAGFVLTNEDRTKFLQISDSNECQVVTDVRQAKVFTTKSAAEQATGFSFRVGEDTRNFLLGCIVVAPITIKVYLS